KSQITVACLHPDDNLLSSAEKVDDKVEGTLSIVSDTTLTLLRNNRTIDLYQANLTLSDFNRGELDGALVRTGKADDQNVAFAQMRGGFLKIFEAANRAPIGFEDDVSGGEARVGGGAKRITLRNEPAARDLIAHFTDTQLAQGFGSVFAH